MTSFFTQVRTRYKRRPAYPKWLFWLVSLYLLFCAILGGLIPAIAKQQLPQQLGDILGRQVIVQDIRINPFTTELTVTGFAINEQNDDAQFVSFDRLYANLQVWQSLRIMGLVLEDVVLEQPKIRVARRQDEQQHDVFNFSDIIERIASDSSAQQAEQQPQAAEMLSMRMANIQLIQGTFTLDDQVTDTLISYPNIQFKLSQFDSILAAIEDQQDLVNQFNIAIEDQYQGGLNLQGQLQLSPLMLQGDINLANIDLSRYWSFIDQLFAINLAQGQLSVNGHYNIALQDEALAPISDIKISRARIIIENVKAVHQQDEKISIGVLAINNINVDTPKQQVTIDEFYTEKGNINLNITPTGADLATLLLPKNTELVSNADNTAAPTSAPNTPENVNSVDNVNTAAQTQPTQPASQDQPWLVTLNQLKLDQYQVTLGEGIASDNIIIWQLGPINVSTGKVVSDFSSPIDYQFSTGINAQSQLNSNGQIDVLAQSINADIDFNNMLLTRLQPYIAPYINVTVTDGIFSTKGTLSADANDSLIYQGQAQIAQLDIKDNVLKQPLLNWETMDINQLSYDRKQAKIDIDEINFDSLFSRLIISADRSTNISQLIHDNTPATDTPEAEVSEPQTVSAATQESPEANADSAQMQININRIGFKDSSAFFADNSLTPNFASGIELLNGDITNLSSNPQTTASVDLAGKIDKYAPVTLKGDVNPLLEQPYLDLNLNFKKVELTSVNPYSGTYAGYYIDKGQLSLDLNYQLKDSALVGSNHLVIDQLKLGKRSNSEEATSLPVSLAVALLQDRHGVIDLGVDVEGDIDSPSFSFGSVIVNALGNVITKVVTSPFSFIAGLVGSEEAIDKVSFDHGVSTIEHQQQLTLDKLASALIERPLLNLNIKGSVDVANDQPALAERKLHKKLAKTAAMKLPALPQHLSASQFPASGPLTDALYVLFEQELGQLPNDIKQTIVAEVPEITPEELTTRWHISLYNMLKNNQQVSADDLGLLAQARARAVKAYLVEQGQIDAGKIFVLESRINTNQNAAMAMLELQAK
ncbi:DUF748 domain-containing protein [Shewanella saliphila]|uniref:DUF748 domain-containing protein n=1 Tax=Shewanella saliphila TaxID=2282698 RepID=A0ABQ2Q1T8_9GAMM|nr:DUF748 domain-containing protein [Shewanella saliphila]MCL1100087.1 DUF748 domain-containing protein [Shewanella saliphila]GGP39599.1 hypothetical protein GCM10009409_03260 [Shewanella saliphila]